MASHWLLRGQSAGTRGGDRLGTAGRAGARERGQAWARGPVTSAPGPLVLFGAWQREAGTVGAQEDGWVCADRAQAEGIKASVPDGAKGDQSADGWWAVLAGRLALPAAPLTLGLTPLCPGFPNPQPWGAPGVSGTGFVLSCCAARRGQARRPWAAGCLRSVRGQQRGVGGFVASPLHLHGWGSGLPEAPGAPGPAGESWVLGRSLALGLYPAGAGHGGAGHPASLLSCTRSEPQGREGSRGVGRGAQGSGSHQPACLVPAAQGPSARGGPGILTSHPAPAGVHGQVGHRGSGGRKQVCI